MCVYIYIYIYIYKFKVTFCEGLNTWTYFHLPGHKLMWPLCLSVWGFRVKEYFALQLCSLPKTQAHHIKHLRPQIYDYIWHYTEPVFLPWIWLIFMVFPCLFTELERSEWATVLWPAAQKTTTVQNYEPLVSSPSPPLLSGTWGKACGLTVALD